MPKDKLNPIVSYTSEDTNEDEITQPSSSTSRGTKKRSFIGLFKDDGPNTKIPKTNQKFILSNLKFLMVKSVEQQKKEELVLLLKDIEKVRDRQIVDGKPFNFGLYDVNGISVEVLIYLKSEQLRFKTLLKEVKNDTPVLIISGWTWYINNSKFITEYMIHHKINIGRETQMRFVSTEDLVSFNIFPFKLSFSIERLITQRCFSLFETTWFMVARPPKYFYGNYSGVLICDGSHYGIVAIDLADSGDIKTCFKFEQDKIFKLTNVNTKLLDVAHRNFPQITLDHFLLNDVLKPCVFYVDEKTNIVEDDTAEVEFGENDTSDIVYPEKSDQSYNTPLAEIFKSLKPN